MTRRYGRAPVGQRLIGYAPHGHWKTTTFIAALRHEGLTAPAVFDGPIDGESFLAYVRQILVPTLRPGDIVVMDTVNLFGKRSSSLLKNSIFVGPSAFSRMQGQF